MIDTYSGRRALACVTLPAALLGALLGVLALQSCSLLPTKLAEKPPPLFDMEEPLALASEPQDEAQRAALAPGSFTGIQAADARRSLDEMLDEPAGIAVASVVENSPADVAGIAAGDLLLEAQVGDGKRALKWPSEWRELEIATPPDTEMKLVYDRAGLRRETRLHLVARVRTAAREAVERFREEEHAGVVLRTATEVEARAAGVGPGGGAVIVGLARTSPWRKAGLQFGDLVRAVDGREVAHPNLLMEAIRSGVERLRLEIVRNGERRTIEARLSARKQQVQDVSIPILFSYESDRGTTSTSVLLGLVKYEHTPASWRWRLLWIFSFSGGDADRLKELRS